MTAAAKRKAADPRQLQLGLVADCPVVVPKKLVWTPPQHAAPDLAHKHGEQVVLHNGLGHGTVCAIVARFGEKPPILVARWPNSGLAIEYDETSGKMRRPTKKLAAWRITPADITWLAEHRGRAAQ